MAEFTAQELHDELEKVEYSDLAHTKIFVSLGGVNLRVIGSHHEMNGGAVFLLLDEMTTYKVPGSRKGDYPGDRNA